GIPDLPGPPPVHGHRCGRLAELGRPVARGRSDCHDPEGLGEAAAGGPRRSPAAGGADRPRVPRWAGGVRYRAASVGAHNNRLATPRAARMRPFDLTGLRTYDLHTRSSKVAVTDLGRTVDPSTPVGDWLDSLPKQLAANELRKLRDHLVRA